MSDDIIKRLSEAIGWLRAQQYIFDSHPKTATDKTPGSIADNIAALLDRLDKAERENERLRAERDEHARWRADLADKLHDAESQIFAAWAALRRAGIQSEETVAEAIALLHAENERLREDAERYRWLTDDHPEWETRERVSDIAFRISVSGKGHIDAAIDAERAAEQSDEV